MNLSLFNNSKKLLSFAIKRYWIIGFVILVIAIVSHLSYLTTYSFLYGYYFGGELEDTISNFEIFRRIAPFHFNTIAITWLMITLSVTLIINSIKAIIEKKFLSVITGILSLGLFHLFLTLFFTKDLNKITLLYLSGIWVLPLFIASLVIFSVYSGRSPMKTLSGLLFGLSIFMFCIFSSTTEISVDALAAALIIITFGFSAIFVLLPNNKHLNFIFIYPYVFIPLVIIDRYLLSFRITSSSHIISKLLLLVLIPLLVSVCISMWRNRKIKVENIEPYNSSIQRGIFDSIQATINNTGSTLISLFLIIGLLGAYVGIPRISTSAAKVIRTFTPESQIHFETITINDINGNARIFKCRIVGEYDNVIYVSNECWKLEQIKVDKYYVSNSSELTNDLQPTKTCLQ